MMSVPHHPQVAKAGAILLAWTVAAVAGAALQTLAGGPIGGATASFRSTLDVYAAHLWLWAAATPAILAVARRFPIAGRVRWRNLALHVGLGSAFVLVFNIAIRLPTPIAAVDDVPLADLWSSSLLGFARWYPLALIVYLAVVALGHALTGAGAAVNTGRPAIPGVSSERAAEPRGHGDTATARPTGGEASEAPDRPGVSDPSAPARPDRLAVRTDDGIRLIPTHEIDWIEADDNQVRIYTGERAHRGHERLGELERRLGTADFVRIHRSALVRIDAIRELRSAGRGDYTVVLRTGRELRLTRTRTAALEALIGRPL